AKETGVKDYVILRTVKLYKIKVKLDVKGSITEKETPTNSKTKPENYLLTEEDKKVIKITQVDIPLVSRPFKEFGMKLNLSEGEVINKLKSYLENGIMRRFVAILFHRNVGFKSNGMVVWKINKEKVDELGYKLASFKNVSHCYERTTNKNWKYNLFSMIHAKSSKDIENFVEKFAKEENIEDYKILYSTREFKKRRIKYFSDEFYRWENRYTKN
ncbi:MAG: Lrp/AsnC family transcriptional regulator, partial [Persephonella sp.]